MGKNIIKLNHFNSLAAQASQDATKKMADVASVTGSVIRDLASQVVMTGSSIAIIADDTEPDNDNAYWFYITDSVVNLKSPKKNNSRDTVYFFTHVDHIEGLSTVTTVKSGLMSPSDKIKLNSLSNYILPVATSSSLGGVKIGVGITINEGAISVNIFEGATTSSNGLSGNVPAPTAGDQDKFLRGDGTWAVPLFTFGSTSSAVEGATWIED